jgi:hypothetical protein
VFAQLKDSGLDENSGPMEAKKNNILKQTKELEDEIVNVQKSWIGN